jgi:hypothetical protein
MGNEGAILGGKITSWYVSPQKIMSNVQLALKLCVTYLHIPESVEGDDSIEILVICYVFQ